MARRNGLLKDIVYGMIGGVIGTVILEQVANVMYEFESEENKEKERQLRKEDPATTMVGRVSGDLVGVELSDEAKSKLGQVVHWGTGIGAGGIYGALHDRLPVLSTAAGLPYGLAFFLLVDEGLNTALRLTP